MRNKIIIALFSILTIVGACKSKKSKSNSTNDLLAGVERSYCYGKCQVYKFMIFQNGKVLYEGIANVEKIGKFEGNLSPENLKKIILMAEEIPFDTYQKEYKDEGVQDLPTISTFYKEFKVSDTGGKAPRELRNFQDYLDGFLKEVVFNE